MLTDADLSYFDAATTVFGLIAIWLQGRKQIECWWMFLSVDVASIGIYAVKGLYPSIGLRVAFVAVDVYGLRGWRKEPGDATRSKT